MGPPVAPVGPMTSATCSGIAKPRLLETPAAIGDVKIRVKRNDLQHVQLGVSDLSHDRRNTRERNISATQGIVLVTPPGRIGKVNEAEAVADTAQSLRWSFTDEVSVGHVVDDANGFVPITIDNLHERLRVRQTGERHVLDQEPCANLPRERRK